MSYERHARGSTSTFLGFLMIVPMLAGYGLWHTAQLVGGMLAKPAIVEAAAPEPPEAEPPEPPQRKPGEWDI